MTIALAHLDREATALTFIADSRISGGANTESGAKIFSLPIEVVVPTGSGRFRVNYRTAFGFAFSGSTLSALNAHAFLAGCLQNLTGKPGDSKLSLADVAAFAANVAKIFISDVISRSEQGLSHPHRYFFNALIGGYCDHVRQFELYQLQPVLQNGVFEVACVRLDLAADRFFPIGSATDAFVALCEEMAAAGYARGAYGALELLLALGHQPDVGGWIQYGEAIRGGFHLRPTVRPNWDDPSTMNITFLGIDTDRLEKVGPYSIGYQVRGPAPPVNWLRDAVQHWRSRKNQ